MKLHSRKVLKRQVENIFDVLDMVFGDRFRHKSRGLLVISKLLGGSGLFYFSFHSTVCLIRELPSNVWQTDGENIRLVM